MGGGGGGGGMLGSCADIPELLTSCINPWILGLDLRTGGKNLTTSNQIQHNKNTYFM